MTTNVIMFNPEYKTCYPVSVGNSKLSSSLWSNSRVIRTYSSRQRGKNRCFSSGPGSDFMPEKNKDKLEVKQELKPLWDDGYGTQTVKDYLGAAKDMIKSDGGPPRWFCPIESGPPLKNSPVLLYLHLNLCRNRRSWNGSHLAPQGSWQATSFNRSKLQPLLPFLEAFPDKFDTILPYIMGTTLGDPIKMANVINTKNPSTSPAKQIKNLILELSSLMTGVSNLSDILPKQTLIWKLKLLKSASTISNPRLSSIKHEALILASGKDNIFPSKSEAQRLSDILKHSRVRFFKDNGHALLMEDGINLLTILKATCMYRRSKKRDYVTDFLPPSISESQKAFDQLLGIFRVAISPVMFSTLDDGKIVRGLKGVPDEGPVLLVGYHMLLGSEIGSIIEEFLREKNVMVNGMAHPEIFTKNIEKPLQEISGFDYFKVFGATPATSINFFKLLLNKSHVLLYPGGIREALHRKGEEYKLFWPDEPEFVRMAAKFGAKIVPFGVVGEDDLVKLFLDYDDLMRIPLAKEMIKLRNENVARVRVGSEMKGEVSKQDFFVPGFYPKVPGRFYFLFGKPMETKGRGDLVKDKVKANEFYLKIKSEVERSMAYLMKKREEDPYRHVLDRLLYRAVLAPVHQIPTFDP